MQLTSRQLWQRPAAQEGSFLATTSSTQQPGRLHARKQPPNLTKEHHAAAQPGGVALGQVLQELLQRRAQLQELPAAAGPVHALAARQLQQQAVAAEQEGVGGGIVVQQVAVEGARPRKEVLHVRRACGGAGERAGGGWWVAWQVGGGAVGGIRTLELDAWA